jgi:uncharacterized membrane protein
MGKPGPTSKPDAGADKISPSSRAESGRWEEMLRKISLILLAGFFILAGANHFRVPEFYLPMMPDWLPWHRALIAASGAAEMLGGIGLILPKWRRLAGWWLIAVLAGVFPANVHMLLHDVPLAGNHVPAWILWIRLPLQVALMAWVWWAKERGASSPLRNPSKSR